ncbi:MAG: S41 family peptidase [Acidobacteriota bacterium]
MRLFPLAPAITIHAAALPLTAVLLLTTASPAVAEAATGYYRFPAIHDEVVVFTAEGDLWRVEATGGEARRLTTHPGQEAHAAISPDGRRVAFAGDYEGPTEVYVMPLEGGQPRRLTWEGDTVRVVGWSPTGEILYATRAFSMLPNVQMVRLDPSTGQRTVLPLAQAADGVYDPSGETLFFTRLPFQGSYTKRYRGGMAQSLWRFDGAAEAGSLTADFPGTSREPMWWKGRVVFVSERDGTLNLWSMAPDGSDLRQHTRHTGWDVKSPDLSGNRVVYQLGADLHLFDLESGTDRKLEITLASDFDQRRERWIDEPLDYLTSAHLSPAGDRVVLTARGQVFVVPAGTGRLVEASRPQGVRFRNARFLPAADSPGSEPAADADAVVVLSDESGEVEFWKLDPRGVEAAEQLTRGGTELRFDGYPSPDGRRLAYVEKDHELWVLDLAAGEPHHVATSLSFGFGEIAWSPDGRWLAFGIRAANDLSQIRLYDSRDHSILDLTSDRFNSHDPAWSSDGRWIYFLSERHLVSLSREPWGIYQPGPFLDRTTKIYQVALRQGLRSPFMPVSEIDAEIGRPTGSPNGEGGKGEPSASDGKGGKKKLQVEIDRDGLMQRLHEVPVRPGNYSGLAVNDKHLFWLDTETSLERTLSLQALAIRADEPAAKTLLPSLDFYELSQNGHKLLIGKRDKLYVVDAEAEPLKNLGNSQLSLGGWAFALQPREEWRQMFRDAWRLLRDYFYDPGMHGVDWQAMLDKYLPLVDRVTDRAELSDLFGELTGELSTLHHYVRGGDHREGTDQILPASLGARLERDEAAGGYRVAHIYATDPDLPAERSPLARPGVEVDEGDVVLAINGVATLSVADPGVLLRHQAGKPVLLQVKPGAKGDAASGGLHETIVEPITPRQARELRYDAWEHERRLRVEAAGEGDLGYVHLRAMGGSNYTEWARHYFPVYHRKGLIIDVRHNRGGNIDSWILGSLIRRPWMWWKPRHGRVYRNMQFAFAGHMVVLVNERTASDGEAFAEGFRRLGLGKVIGTRTWGGEIWLTSSNFLVDQGIATAAEFGVYGPEGEWLIEGHGVEPDIVVDNPPHATFDGEDAQLEAAIEYLQQRIRDDPPTIPQPPPYPDKSFRPSPN